MTSTIFFHLLAHEDKDDSLAEAIKCIAEGTVNAPDTYVVDSQCFDQIPGSPFAYWVSDETRRKFAELPPFEDEGRIVRQGLATADDFRFVRTWWEVEPVRSLSGRSLDFPDVLRKRTHISERWVPFAKGGTYSPYYADLHLVVNWEKDGTEMKAWADPLYDNSGWSRIIKSPDLYFRPGLTWPLRASKFAPLALSAGSIFSVRGYAILAPSNCLPSLLGLGASRYFDYLFKVMLGRFGFPEYVVGILQKLPTPSLDTGLGPRLGAIARRCIDLKRALDTATITGHAFTTIALLQLSGDALAQRASAWQARIAEAEATLDVCQAEIDEIVYQLYGTSLKEREAIEASYDRFGHVEILSEEDGPQIQENDLTDGVDTECSHLVSDLLSYAVGCSFGRWDVRIGLDPTLASELADPFAPLPVCSPGMLVGPDALPAMPGCIASEEWLRARPDAITLSPGGSVQRPTIPDSEYPIRVSWNGLLADDPDHQDDIVERVREVLGVLWADRAEEIEVEACQSLGVRDLRDYFAKPSSFFADHLRRYSKSRRQAPICWPLSSATGSYTLWVYYHRLTSDTLYTAVNRYVAPMIEETRRRLSDLETRLVGATGREASSARSRIEETKALLSELEEFQRELLRVAALPYRPDLNDGVIINAAPLHRLFRLPKWAKDTRECWEGLQRGDYDWARMAYNLWPDRVREKCRSDRSLAIAHGLEDLCVAPPASAKKRRKRATRPTEQDDEGAGERDPSWPPEELR